MNEVVCVECEKEFGDWKKSGSGLCKPCFALIFSESEWGDEHVIGPVKGGA